MTPYQPYQRLPDRPQTPALAAMLLGRPMILPNVMDQWRLAAKRKGLYGMLTGR